MKLELLTEISYHAAKAYDQGFLSKHQRTYTMMPSGLMPDVDLITNLPAKLFDVVYGCWCDFGKDPDIYCSCDAYDICGNLLDSCFSVRCNWMNPMVGRKFALFCGKMCPPLSKPSLLSEVNLIYPRMGMPTKLEQDLWSLSMPNSILDTHTSNAVVIKTVEEAISDDIDESTKMMIVDRLWDHVRMVDVPSNAVVDGYKAMYVAWMNGHVYNFIPDQTGVGARFLWLAWNTGHKILSCWPEPNHRLRVFGANIKPLAECVPELDDGQDIVRYAQYELFPSVNDDVIAFMKNTFEHDFLIEGDIEE